MPWKGNPTGNYSYSSSGKGICPSCGKAYTDWPELQCTRKQLHDPYALENPPSKIQTREKAESERYSEALDNLLKYKGKLKTSTKSNQNSSPENVPSPAQQVDPGAERKYQDLRNQEREKDDEFSSIPAVGDQSFQVKVEAIPKRASIFRRFRRKFRRNRAQKYRWPRFRKIHSFLILWIASFLAGFYLTSMAAVLLVFVSLIDAIMIFIPLFIVWWLFHRRIAGKVFAVFLILVFGIYVYQNPVSFTKSSLTNDFFTTEGSFLSSIPSLVNAGSSSGGSINNLPQANNLNNGVTTTSANLIQQVVSQLQPDTINSEWVSSFFTIVNSYRSSPLTESSTLDQFAAIRFNTITSHYEISHYGYDQDFQNYFAGQAITGGEEYFYPDSSPSSYVNFIETQAPVHWQGLIDSTYTHYGYYIGKGPVIEVYQPCSAPSEIVGSINQTQQLISYGCNYSVVTGTYLVIELSS